MEKFIGPAGQAECWIRLAAGSASVRATRALQPAGQRACGVKSIGALLDAFVVVEVLLSFRPSSAACANGRQPVALRAPVYITIYARLKGGG